MATLISAFRNGILPDVTGCPAFIVDKTIIDAIVKLCIDASIIERSFEHSVDASVDVDTTDNNAIEIDLTAYITDVKPYIIKSLKIDNVGFATQYKEVLNNISDIENHVDSGIKFFNFPDDETIKLFPMSDEKDVNLLLNIIWVPIHSITTIDDVFYRNHNYRMAIESYSKWMLLRQPGKTWTDVSLADYNLTIYSRSMEEVKIQILQGKSFGSLRLKSLRFF